MKNTTLKETLESFFPFWKKISQEEKELLEKSTTLRNYKAGQNIHGADATCTGIMLVLNGEIRSYMLSEEGREVTLFKLFKGDICTLSASCVLSTISFDIFVDANTDCDVLIIKPSAFSKIISNNIYAENFMLKITTSRFSDVMWAMQQILFMSFDKRLASFLLDESIRTKNLKIKMTQEQIAKNIGSAREVVSRMLKYFTSEGIVKVERGTIEILDKDKLRKIIL